MIVSMRRINHDFLFKADKGQQMSRVDILL